MNCTIKAHNVPLTGSIALSSSKSESNRALLINALGAGGILKNLSDARDTQTMHRLLSEQGETWDVLDAGTTMRFCTAYLAIYGDNKTITGTDRMQQRPIRLLVDALNHIGADIQYLNKIGYPPLRINKIQDQISNRIDIPGNVSSQYISALLMIAPILPHGLNIHLIGEIFSKPYIEMTLGLMKHFGVEHQWSSENVITIGPQTYTKASYTIESDWSGASYWYSMVALQPGSQVLLQGLREHSFQGDQEIVQIMNKLGVATEYLGEGAELTHIGNPEKHLEWDFRTCPDLAQTVMVTAALLGTELIMTGLESLKIKETDRVAAMKNELCKLGATLTEEKNSWNMKPGIIPVDITTIETYEDHRMAMAFAPVGMIHNITIRDPEVVNKSYPTFWEHLAAVNIKLNMV